MTYSKRMLIAVDQFINALLGGWLDETLYSRCYRWARDVVRDWPRRFIDGLPFGRLDIANAPTRENGKGCNVRLNCGA